MWLDLDTVARSHRNQGGKLKDRVGQVYLAVGGLMGGSAGSTFLAGIFTSFPLWGLVISGLLTVVGLYMLLAVLLDLWLPGRKSSLGYVIEKAQELSGAVAIWIGERRRSESDFYPRPDSWEADTQRMMRQSDDTMIRWNELYAVKALTAYDQLVAHGAEDTGSGRGGRSLFEHPTNRLGIEEIGRTLGVMAAHLEMKAMTRQ